MLTDEIAEKGSSKIPVLSFEETKNMWPEKRTELQSVGCFVVRGVVDKPTADEWFLNAKSYVEDNKFSITGRSSNRQVYSSIWEGKPDSHDPYDLNLRKGANQAFFEGSAHSSVFRSFQGWTALTEAGLQEGSLLL
ncbi:hypothetical protein LTR08_000976 [Meristemomyces frigidus]|nr:hypothetical protein LTR08_000976 [Meristemomyces frigidus]